MNYEYAFIPDPTYEDLYTVVDSKEKQKRMLNDLNLTNPRFHKINKNVYTKLGKKVQPIEFYSTGPIGSTITHAISGSKQKGHIVGSSNEDLFFKVSFNNSKINNERITLFYYSPEECEKHQLMDVSDDIKSKWKAKFIKASIKLKLDK